MKFVKFPSIEQFRNTIRDIKQTAQYVGLDESSEPIYEKCQLPVIDVQCTVKLHGSNSAIGYDGKNLWVQSRQNIITPENDNAEFARFVNENSSEILKLFALNEFTNHLIFGEWCGKGIQKGVGIAELPKMFVVFGVLDLETDTFLKLSPTLQNHDIKVYNILEFPTFKVQIDFNHPEKAQQEIFEIVEKVEAECPVAKAFGVSGIGEGIVGTFEFKGKRFAFKAKGKKHSKSKVKSAKPVDIEKLNAVEKCVEAVSHDWRYNQALTEIFGVDFEENIDARKIGDFLRFVMKDTLKEEMDIIAEHGFTMKDIQGKLTQKAKDYFFAVMDVMDVMDEQ